MSALPAGKRETSSSCGRCTLMTRPALAKSAGAPSTKVAPAFEYCSSPKAAAFPAPC